MKYLNFLLKYNMLSNSIMKFFCGLGLMINGVLSQGPIGGTLDANNCLDCMLHGPT